MGLFNIKNLLWFSIHFNFLKLNIVYGWLIVRGIYVSENVNWFISIILFLKNENQYIHLMGDAFFVTIHNFAMVLTCNLLICKGRIVFLFNMCFVSMIHIVRLRCMVIWSVFVDHCSCCSIIVVVVDNAIKRTDSFYQNKCYKISSK